jgi:hypothetical protein
LAKQAQNPIADLISVPFQNNTNFNVGPEAGTQNILNIQPVIPITRNTKWNVITRTILPVIHQPSYGPQQGSAFGLGDLQFSGFLSPRDSDALIWGVGAVAQLPTHTDSALGNDNPGLGPTAVAPTSVMAALGLLVFSLTIFGHLPPAMTHPIRLGWSSPL